MNLNTPLFSSGGSPMAFPKITESAYGAWGLYDIYGTGNDVVRLRNANSTPTERDFTAIELTNGTYSSWYSSGNTFVTKLYDQKGSNDIVQGSSSGQPKYSSADNTIQHYAVNNYFRSSMYSSVSSDIANTFDGNEIDTVTTLTISARTGDMFTGFNKYNMFALSEGFAPTQVVNTEHRMLATGGGQFAQKVGVSMRTLNGSYSTFDNFENALPSTLTTFSGLFARRAVSGNTVTDFELYEDGTKEIDETTTILGTGINADRFYYGDNVFKSSAMLVFNKELTADEHSELHTILSANY